MLLEVSKLSRLNRKHWFFKYSNLDFDEILNLIIHNLDYDYIELSIWSFQLDLFNNIKYDFLKPSDRLSTIKLDKSNSLKILDPATYENIRLFEIKMFKGSEKLFDISSDNYGEYTSITMDKNICEGRLFQLLNVIFT